MARVGGVPAETVEQIHETLSRRRTNYCSGNKRYEQWKEQQHLVNYNRFCGKTNLFIYQAINGV